MTAEIIVEIWNNVFMEYYKSKDGTYSKLKQQNVDTGNRENNFYFMKKQHHLIQNI